MALMWFKDADAWCSWVLTDFRYVLPPSADAGFYDPDEAGQNTPSGVLIQRNSTSEPVGWFLLAPAEETVTVNGLPFPGIRLLRDRDQIDVCGHTLFFSTEKPVHVVPLPEASRALECPRCKRPIKVGFPAVCCPDCEVWHHQTPESDCWTYSESCAVCNRSTDPVTGCSWSPDHE